MVMINMEYRKEETVKGKKNYTREISEAGGGWC